MPGSDIKTLEGRGPCRKARIDETIKESRQRDRRRTKIKKISSAADQPSSEDYSRAATRDLDPGDPKLADLEYGVGYLRADVPGVWDIHDFGKITDMCIAAAARKNVAD